MPCVEHGVTTCHLRKLLHEDMWLLQGVGTAQDIDNGMKLGTNQPMGPLQLADFIGLYTCSLNQPTNQSMLSCS